MGKGWMTLEEQNARMISKVINAHELTKQLWKNSSGRWKARGEPDVWRGYPQDRTGSEYKRQAEKKIAINITTAL